MSDNKETEDPRSRTATAASDDARFVQRALLAAYQPVLEQQLNLIANPQELERQVQAGRQSCAEEFAEAYALFEKFLTEEVAQRLLPAQARERLGPIENWRECLRHIRCCLVFGWLACRWPRTFRGFAYYLYEYWKCVRQVIGNPVSDPPTAEQRRDFETLVTVLAAAFKPYLSDQLASVEFPTGVPNEVISGAIDCFTDDRFGCDIFERLLTTEAARALFGETAFGQQTQQPSYGFCRCWCLCSLCFGCCLARARNIRQIVLCLDDYLRCLTDCLRPLICQITDPASGACGATTLVAACGDAVAVEITGSATGSSFDHYVLRYSWGGGSPVNDAVIYPDCARPPGTTSFGSPVVGGILGYLDTFLLPPGVSESTIYLDVYDPGGGSVECTQTFEVRYSAIAITAVAAVNAQYAPDPFQPPSPPPPIIKLIPAAFDPGFELSVGGKFSVTGSAYTTGCNRILTQFQLFEFPLSPLGASPPVVPVFTSGAGGTPLGPPPVQPVVYMDNPTTHPWNAGCLFPIPNTIENGNLVAQWSTEDCFVFVPTPFPGHFVHFTKPQVLPVPFWDSGPLNGRFVVLLEVRDHQISPPGPFPGDVAGADYVVVWIDNQGIIGQIYSIGGITGCGDLVLSHYLGTTAAILGQAWDPPIDPTAPQKQPNDNFGQYTLTFQKDGDPLASGTITTSTNRVPNIWPGPLLPGDLGTLANWDIVAALDGGTGVLPPHSPKLPRGQRCAYVVTLVASDTTHVGDSGNNHSTGDINYAIEVINDLGP